jgi:Xaa-Pro aminopeptidase
MISSNFYAENRNRLAKTINGNVIILTAHSKMQRGNDAAHNFEQESNFWYLTGIEASDWRAIVDIDAGKSWLVAPEVSESHQVFDGSLDLNEAMRISGVDGVLSSSEGAAKLNDLSKKYKTVHTIGDHPHLKYFDFVVNPAQKILSEELTEIFTNVHDCRPDLSKLRAIKYPEEIEAIKKAVKLSADIFALVKKKLPDLRHEYEVEAEFTYHSRKNGASGHAYDPIVAAGGNACTLHYGDNKDTLPKNGLLLLDIGARFDGYPADITRTYALGEPSDREKAVHSAVRRAHKEIINILKPGLSFENYQNQVDKIMQREIVGLGLMNSMEDTKNYRKYFPHAISHGLGVDVHDSLGGYTEFMPGMVLTVEPGIYIPEEGIGVRIEDDILITKSGTLNLSGDLSTEL